MAAMADVQRDGFDERIRRIQRGGPNTTATIYVGPADTDAEPKKARRKLWQRRQRGAHRAEPTRASPLSAIYMWPFALVVGALAMFAGRVAAFQLALQPEVLPPEYAQIMLLMADVTIAAVLMIALVWAFRLGGGFRRLLLVAGFLGVMMGESLIIKQAPDVFVPFFSQNYVAAQMSRSAPIQTLPETLETLSQNRVLLPQGLPFGS